MKAAFLTYNGAGLPARVNASRAEKVAAYEFDKLKWDPSWNEYFIEKTDPEITTKYYALVSALLADTVNPEIPTLHP
jgi:hypothetical protein